MSPRPGHARPARAAIVCAAAGLILAVGGCGTDLTDAAADNGRDLARQLAVAIGDRLPGTEGDARVREVDDVLADAAIQGASAEVVLTERAASSVRFTVLVTAASGRGGGWFSEEVAVWMCVAYDVPLAGGAEVHAEGTRCPDDVDVPERYRPVRF